MNSPDCLYSPREVRPENPGNRIAIQNLVRTGMLGSALDAVLDGMTIPMLLVTARSRIVFLNAAARRSILDCAGLTVESDVLCTALRAETRVLHHLISETAQISVANVATWTEIIKVSKPCGRQWIELLVTPLVIPRDDRFRSESPSAALFVMEPRLHTETNIVLLIKHYGLTPCEARVAVAVCRGLSGKEICRERNIRYNTLKTHMKSIYAKMNARRQTDLIRIISEGLHSV